MSKLIVNKRVWEWITTTIRVKQKSTIDTSSFSSICWDAKKKHEWHMKVKEKKHRIEDKNKKKKKEEYGGKKTWLTRYLILKVCERYMKTETKMNGWISETF